MTAGDRKDRVFARPLSEVKAFEFNETVAAVFQARSPELPPRYWIGDLMELFAAVVWAATTL